ncbi:MAG: hypothetical protein V5B35_02890 [Candidatus Accumulibacter necessarius]|jgi:phenylpropionate dioxygenase-like ring-hydroxylating dioxygenase large terminal subunit
MRFSEFAVSEARKAVAPVPSVLKQQQRVGKVMQQISASDQQQEPTEMDKVLAMRQYANWQKQTDQLYRQRLKQQLAAAK